MERQRLSGRVILEAIGFPYADVENYGPGRSVFEPSADILDHWIFGRIRDEDVKRNLVRWIYAKGEEIRDRLWENFQQGIGGDESMREVDELFDVIKREYYDKIGMSTK